MTIFIITLTAFIVVMLAMAIGVLLGNSAIKGSCGGLNDIDGLAGGCDICEGKKRCKRRRAEQKIEQ